MERLYANIGKKLKSWAVSIFIVEAIGAIITGITMLVNDLGWGWLVLLVGPVAAWLSTLVLYAFGELVDKTCDNETNTQNIEKLLQQMLTVQKSPSSNEPAPTAAKKKSTPTPKAEMHVGQTAQVIKNEETDTITCSLCGFAQPASRKVCWQCGGRFENAPTSVSPHSWRCDHCGNMATQSPCEHCGK